MLKRQESSLSASRRQAVAGATPPPPETHHAKAIGCMSGIIQLFSKYQNSNRRLTFGKKQRKPPPSPTRSATINAAKTSPSSPELNNSVKQIFDTNRLTCAVKVLRSPTLPPEIRRSNAASSPEYSRTPSSLVARLMGLEDLGATAKRPGLIPENTIPEKRQRLLQALEKCNEDLEALRKIIKAVQTADVRLQPPHSPSAKRDHSGNENGDSVSVGPCMKMCTELPAAEKPSIPMDELTRSPVSSYSVVQNSPAALNSRRYLPLNEFESIPAGARSERRAFRFEVKRADLRWERRTSLNSEDHCLQTP